MENKQQIREQWFIDVLPRLQEKVFKEHKFPDVAISCGPCRGNAIGCCYHKESSEVKRAEIFIDPSQVDTQKVLGILVHELIHAILPDGESHGRGFRKMMKYVGLVGKATATGESEELKSILNDIVTVVGEYPHHKLNTKVRKRGANRAKFINFICYNDGYQLKTKDIYAEQATPNCPICEEEMSVK